MGKAFTGEERDKVKDKLRREGLVLLAQDGIRNVSIRELTKRAGIAQGGFYTFYKDKDEFVTDLVLLRIREKTDLMLETKEGSLEDPVKYISDILYREGMHLKENKAFNNHVSGSIEFFAKRDEPDNGEGREIYRNFLRKLVTYWEENGYRVECDIDGIIYSGVMGAVMFSNADLIPEEYFAGIYREYCDAQTKRYLHVAPK
ncbi:MAG: TetR/AcrR family transcriptional regulator [Lachnospiraceae bacterium]|nr:TetR/AcrR family transcriptional regulator [Lachnospiraceae bacterium]